MRRLGEMHPQAKQNAQKASLALANTAETAARMRLLGAERIEIVNSAALSDADLNLLIRSTSNELTHSELTPTREAVDKNKTTFASVGRLLEWKGFHLGLHAFAQANISNAAYLIIGSGPQEDRLRDEVKKLGLSATVTFIPSMPRMDLLKLLAGIDALIHPSMHESGGYVVLEAMASGTPVICLDAGGPGLFVSDKDGYKARTQTSEMAVNDLASSMAGIAYDQENAEKFGLSGQSRVQNLFTMRKKLEALSAVHSEFAGNNVPPTIKSNSRSPIYGDDRLARQHLTGVKQFGISK